MFLNNNKTKILKDKLKWITNIKLESRYYFK